MRKSHPAAGTPSQARGSWAARCTAEARAYLTRVCGSRARRRAVEHALAKITEAAAAGAGPQTVERIRATVRDTALAEVERSTKTIGGRLRSLSHLRRGCADVPGLLRARATGELSADQLATLHKRLDRCSHCAALTARVDAAEWRLQTALDGAAGASPPTGPKTRTPKADTADPLAPSGSPTAQMTPGAQPANQPRPPAAPTATRRIAATGDRRPPVRRSTRRRRGPVAAALLLVVLGGTVVTATGLLDRSHQSPRVVLPLSRRALPATAPVGHAGSLPRSGQLLIGSLQSQRLIVDADQVTRTALLGRRPPAAP